MECFIHMYVSCLHIWNIPVFIWLQIYVHINVCMCDIVPTYMCQFYKERIWRVSLQLWARWQLDIEVSPMHRGCLSHCSMSIRRHHAQGNFYKMDCWQFQCVNPGPSWWEAGRYRTGAVVEIFITCSAGSRQRVRVGLAWTFGTSKPTSETHLLQ